MHLVKPFELSVEEHVLNDLFERLNRTIWPVLSNSHSWALGVESSYMEELVRYWKEDFDWRKQEAALNDFSQFTYEVEGQRWHFLHEKSEGDSKALLLLHGWPDSFYRFYKVIPELVERGYSVVIPSLPGFGFSEPDPQNSVTNAATSLHHLMTEVLGYTDYGIHGGDTGSVLAQEIVKLNPSQIIGLHLTDIGYDQFSYMDRSVLTKEENEFLDKVDQWMYTEGAYIMIQATKPYTLAYALTDSPVALAAWIIEKFKAWSDVDNSLDEKFSKDELLTNVMLYWITKTGGSSIHWYASSGEDWESVEDSWGEEESGGEENAVDSFVSTTGFEDAGKDVPVALAVFPKDIPREVSIPKSLVEKQVNLVRWTPMPSGGHFAALEEPELLVNDIDAFFGQLGS